MTSFILDANIWVSIILNGNISILVEKVKGKRIELFSCKNLFTELEDVLNRPKIKKRLELTVEEYLLLFEIITSHKEIVLRNKICTDPKDDYLFDLLESTDSDFLVTGDKGVLALKNDFQQIISFNQFLQMIL